MAQRASGTAPARVGCDVRWRRRPCVHTDDKPPWVVVHRSGRRDALARARLIFPMSARQRLFLISGLDRSDRGSCMTEAPCRALRFVGPPKLCQTFASRWASATSHGRVFASIMRDEPPQRARRSRRSSKRGTGALGSDRVRSTRWQNVIMLDACPPVPTTVKIAAGPATPAAASCLAGDVFAGGAGARRGAERWRAG